MAITADRLSPLARRLVPSFADLLFVVLLVAHIGAKALADADTGWHLFAGYEVLAHGPRPVPEFLSWTRPGVPWWSVQWLGELAFAALHRYAGFVGVVLLASWSFAATFAWLYRLLLARSGNAVVSIGITLLASMATWPHLLARPEVFAFPFFLVALVLAKSKSLGRARWLLLPLVTALWANVHPSAIAAPVLILMCWWLDPDDSELGVAALVSGLAWGATPNGFGWVVGLIPSRQGLHYLSTMDEWMAPVFRETRWWALWVTILLSLWARMRGGPIPRREAALGIAWLGVTLLTARAGAFAILFWSERLARDLAAPQPSKPGFWESLRASMQPFEDVLKPGVYPVVITIAAFAFAPFLGPRFPSVARGFTDPDFPIQAADYAKRAHLGPRVFNDFGWGGYVSWESNARWKVFVDGRTGIFGDDVLSDYLHILGMDRGWQTVLQRRSPDWILIHTSEPLVQAAPMTGRWAVAWSDTMATILVPTTADPTARTAP